MSKGSKRRPIDPKIERKVFEDNWNRIFSTKMWEHKCKHNGSMRVAIGESCNWCGLKEDGTND